MRRAAAGRGHARGRRAEVARRRRNHHGGAPRCHRGAPPARPAPAARLWRPQHERAQPEAAGARPHGRWVGAGAAAMRARYAPLRARCATNAPGATEKTCTATHPPRSARPARLRERGLRQRERADGVAPVQVSTHGRQPQDECTHARARARARAGVRAHAPAANSTPPVHARRPGYHITAPYGGSARQAAADLEDLHGQRALSRLRAGAGGLACTRPCMRTRTELLCPSMQDG